MKKHLIIIFSILLFFVVFSVVFAAKPSFQLGEVRNPVNGEEKNSIALPPRAIEVAPNIYYLGIVNYEGKLIEGYAFIDYKEKKAKPGTFCGNGICETGENAKKCPEDCGGTIPDSNCYGFLAKGAKWKSIEPYMIDTSNSRNLSSSFIKNNIAFDIDKWEQAAEVNIIGDEIIGNVDGADTISPDNKNEILFGDIDQDGAIAITIVWGIFRGAPKDRQLVEWDQIYDDVDYDWSEDCLTEDCSAKMDFENIATHELGHTVGLDDLYETTCSQETMYGYADYGEVSKRTLEGGDIAGVKELYQ